MLRIGFDEAGYGPNLGPCVLGGAVIETAHLETSIFEALSQTVSQSSVRAGASQIQVADSKLVHQSSRGIGPLERSALSLAAAFGLPIHSLHELIIQLTGKLPDSFVNQPWYAEDRPLPLENDLSQLKALASQLQQNSSEQAIAFRRLSCAILCPEPWNQQLQVTSSKGEVLSLAHFAHLKTLCPDPLSSAVQVTMDRHGGRRRYDSFLETIYPDAFLIRQQESAERSCYKVGRMKLIIKSRAEEQFEVAVGSIIAKYIREALMICFNQYWQMQLPDLKPTKGYPQDAKRFLKQIEAIHQTVGIPMHILWRDK